MNLSIDKGSEKEGLGEEVFILGLKTAKNDGYDVYLERQSKWIRRRKNKKEPVP